MSDYPMTNSTVAPMCRIAILLCLAACSANASEFAPTPDSGRGEVDAGVTDSGLGAEVPRLGTDAGGVADAEAPGTPVSSLMLEQVWYITTQTSDALIDFRESPPKVQCRDGVGHSDGFEGTGVFTDPRTGSLLFYTDGRAVFSGKAHAPLENGLGLTGDQSATEPALITPKNDGTMDRFYIFTNDCNIQPRSKISYSEIDLSLGPNGTVTTKNALLFEGNAGEALDVLPHENGEDFWVLGYSTAAQLQAFLVTKAGPSTTPIVSSTGLSGVVLRSAINHTLDYNTLALAISHGEGKGGLIATARFDRKAGTLHDVATHVTGDVGYQASFSEDGTKLYYSKGVEGWRGVAYQFDLTTQTETLLGGTNMAAAKLAPDGKVYFASFGASHLAVVSSPNNPGAAAGFSAEGLPLGGCQSGYGVPNQTASYLRYLPSIPK